MGIKSKPDLKVLQAFIPFALTAGLMKPWKGLTPVMGKEKNWEPATVNFVLTEKDSIL